MKICARTAGNLSKKQQKNKMIKNLNNRIFKTSFFILLSTIILFGVSCSEKDNSYEEISKEATNSIVASESISYPESNESSYFSIDSSFDLSNVNSKSDESISISFESSFESIENSINDKSNDTDISEIITESSESSDSSSNEDNSFVSMEESSIDVDVSGNEIFNEPVGIEYTTSKGNVFITNCTDESILSIKNEIADTAAEYNKTTVYYTDVKQKYFFAYNVDLIHNTASTIKAPYAAYILQSDADLSEVLVMEKRHIFTGSGVLKNKEPGSKFTVAELIRYMITRSDNTAYAMLLERFGTQGFKEYAKRLNVDFKLPSGGYTTCKAREMAAFLLDIYNFQGTERGNLLIKHMKNCSYSLQIPKAVSHEVAHKFGFIYEGKAFHDMGIVFAPTPYIEIIFTRINGTVYDTKAFIQIGKLVEKLNMELSDNY